MNIIIVNDAAFIRGGADRVALESACALADLGDRVVLFTAFGPVDPMVQAHPGVAVVCADSGWIRQEQASPSAAIRGLWNANASRRLRAELVRFDPQDTVVHVHLYSSALSASVLHASASAGYATVLTLHDYFITCPNGAYFVFPRSERCERRALSWSCLTCNCDSRKRVHKAWRVARTVIQNQLANVPRRLAAFVAVSSTCAVLARRDLPSNARVEVIPNIVGVSRQPPVDAARNQAFVFVGRLEDYKGPQLLAQAASLLGLPVIFCGTGPMEAELKRIYPAAEFTGWLAPDQVIAVLAKARAFVFPSVYRETFGLSAAEALARGIPVVASRETAAEEFVHHQENGLLFEHNSVDSLGFQLSALSDDGLVERLGRAAYEGYWESPLTVAAHVSRLRELYLSVVTGRNPASGIGMGIPDGTFRSA